MIWRFSGRNINDNGKLEFDERLNRTVAPPTVSNGLVFLSDFSGIVHCLDAQTGVRHWRYDAFSAAWCRPLVVDGKVYCCDEDGDVAIFKASSTRTLIFEGNMGNGIYSNPTIANGVLYIAAKSRLFAIRSAK